MECCTGAKPLEKMVNSSPPKADSQWSPLQRSRASQWKRTPASPSPELLPLSCAAHLGDEPTPRARLPDINSRHNTVF